MMRRPSKEAYTDRYYKPDHERFHGEKDVMDIHLFVRTMDEELFENQDSVNTYDTETPGTVCKIFSTLYNLAGFLTRSAV